MIKALNCVKSFAVASSKSKVVYEFPSYYGAILEKQPEGYFLQITFDGKTVDSCFYEKLNTFDLVQTILLLKDCQSVVVESLEVYDVEEMIVEDKSLDAITKTLVEVECEEYRYAYAVLGK